MHFIEPSDRSQNLLFSSLDDFISKKHPVRIIDAIIGNIVKNNPCRFKYKGNKNVGRRAYSAETMLKLFLYGYLNSISSSRKLEVETHRNIELKWLLGNLQPDHKTIANYRKDNNQHIKLMTIEFRNFLKAHNYIKGKTVVVDGSKVKANANREMLTIEKIEQRLSNLDNNLKKYLDKLAEKDVQEDILDEDDNNNKTDSINKHLIEKIIILKSKIEKLEKTKQKIEESGKKYFSITDPDANLMRSRNGKIPAYNIQIATDSENHMIAESQVSTSPTDTNELTPLLESLKENMEIEAEEVFADKGYYSPKEIQKIEEKLSTRCFIPWGKTNDNGISFDYIEDRDEYICPFGKSLMLKAKNKPRRQRVADVYQCAECDGCPFRLKCTKAKNGRILHRYHDHDWCESYKKRIKSDLGKEKIKERKNIVEHCFGTIKYWMGQIPILLRGKEKVQIEINIYATAYNLKRLTNIEGFDNLMKIINEYQWKIIKYCKEGCGISIKLCLIFIFWAKNFTYRKIFSREQNYVF